MELVVDANILFAALIKESVTSELLFDDSLILSSAEFLFQEFEKHREMIREKTQRSDEDFDRLMIIISRRIKLVPYEEFKIHMKQAEEISPDPNDAFYFALAIKLNCAIWSNDKKLKEQDRIKVFSTDELVKMLKE